MNPTQKAPALHNALLFFMRAKFSLCLIAGVLFPILVGSIACSKAPTDRQITSGIETKLNADSGLKGKQLVVQAVNGTVTLSGTVDDDAQRDAAATYASSEAGVKLVVNNLQVASLSPQTVQVQPPVQKKPEPPLISKRHRKHNLNNSSATIAGNPHLIVPPAPAPEPTPVAHTPSPAPPSLPPAQKVTIPSGTTMTVRLVDSVDSEKNEIGDTFHATLHIPLAVNGDVVIPSGSDVGGHIVDVKSAGKFAGQSLLILQLDSISAGGNAYSVRTDQYKKEGSSRGKDTAIKTGAGAGIGAVIGALAGGGKGAAIGAAAGGGLGAGSQALRHGQQVKLPSETVLTFTLQAPLTVTSTNQNPDDGRPKLSVD